MSVEHKWTRRASKDEDLNDLELTITIRGAHDLYRFAHHMLSGQVEFVERGSKIIEQLKRRMGKPRFNHLDRSLGGWRFRHEREPS